MLSRQPHVTPITAPAGSGLLRTHVRDPAICAITIVVALLVRVVEFRGLYGSDDAIYATRALEIAAGVWSPSDYIGALRYGVNLPMAAFVQTLGGSEWALAAWGLFCSLLEELLVWSFARSAWGRSAAILSALVLAFVPLHIDVSTGLTADASFAACLTAAAFLVNFALTRGSRQALFWAGFVCGLQGWVKLEASLVSLCAITALATAYERRPSTIFLVCLGAAIPLVSNFILFWWAFGDPAFYLHVSTHNLQQNFIAQQAPWGTHEAWYYAKLFFIDGRQFWIVPLVAAAGAVAALARPQNAPALFVLAWTLALFVFFSFFVYSLTPFRLIPKQANYAVFFAAPLSLLAGYGLSRAPAKWAGAVLMLHISGGWTLSAIEGYSHRMHAETHRLTIQFARGHPDWAVFASLQTADFNTALRLMGLPHASNLRLLSEVAAFDCSLPAVLAMHSTWPEATRWQERLASFTEYGALSATPADPLGRTALNAAEFLRSALPPAFARQLNFAHAINSAGELKLYAMCGSGNRATAAMDWLTAQTVRSAGGPMCPHHL